MNAVAGSERDAWGRLQAKFTGLTGWRRRGIAFLLGCLAVLAQPPLHVVPVLLVSFTGLVWLLDGSTSKRGAFGCGWWFGLGYFVAGLYWISFAFLVEAAKFGWMIPFALFGLSAGLALYTGLATLLTRLIPCSGPGRVLVLAAAWTAMEWVRGTALTGFPWNPLATVWAPFDAMIQFSSLVGMFGLSLATAILAAAPATVSGYPGRRRWLSLAVAAFLLVVLWAGGVWRLAGAGSGTVPGVTLRLVQPNIDQTLKWRPNLRERHFIQYLNMSKEDGQPTDVVWPETAAPFVVARDTARRRVMATAVPPGGLLLTGSVRASARGERPFRAWNSLHAVDGSGNIVATYDKHHLVPFGEYVPLRSILSIAKLTMGRSDFTPGPGPRTLSLPGLPPVSPLICYEAIFSGEVTDPAARPGWLLNVTNDAWFGISSGPYQHLANARFRAVEEGLPLVRAANTGISAVIDPYGRTIARLALGVSGVLDAPLPRAIAPTVFVHFRHWLLLILIAVCTAAGMLWRGHD